MKKNGTRIGALLLAAMVFLASWAVPVQAADPKAPPTKVTTCEGGGLMPPILNLGFDDTGWMNAITDVTVNGTAYTKGSTSFGSSGNLWEIGSVMGAYGSYTALKIINNSITYPAAIKISAAGYQDLTLKVTKNTSTYPYVYTATVENTPTATTYTAAVAEAENGTVSLSATEDISEGESVTITVSPDKGYTLDTLTVTGASGKTVSVTNKNDKYSFTMPAENVTVKASFKAEEPKDPTKIELSQVSIQKDFFGNDWQLTFSDADGYVEEITGVKVNGTAWTEQSSEPSSGGKYHKDTDKNQLVFAARDFSPTPDVPVLKSGDSVVISADGYEDLAFKLVIDKKGNASLTPDDGDGDPYELHVKIDGSFEAAIVGQKNYDGVSSASTGGSSSSKNSDVTVYGALVEKGTTPSDSDWEELDNLSEIKLNGSKCKVNIIPDTTSGTAADSDSGMEGVYLTISSSLTLSGTPKDPGSYLISIDIEDDQGRTATSNTLPFRIYSGEEKLADQMKTENFKQYDSGLYAWDIMEPWAIKNFGSNVSGETESVRVVKDLEAWFGSHTSGTYGYLGYDLEWKKVESGDIPQTLYIPDGCDLTLTNMEILSSVRIVIEKGGKLTLSDSVVQGIIDVENGGTFSMNYDAYNKAFTTGASISGQLRLQSGAILENAAIYSHANYLANGDRTDRTTSEPVVTATGNVTVKGQVFIEGDEAGGDIGQTALRVTDGTLTLDDNATLVAYGGGGTVIDRDGGTAIELHNGNIQGKGKLIAIGGQTLWHDGGDAVSGIGTISTSEAFLQGATASKSHNAEPGKAVSGTVKVTSSSRYIADGTQDKTTVDDPLKDLYWKSGISTTPPLDQFVVEPAPEHTHEADTGIWKSDENTHWNPCKEDDCEERLNEAEHAFTWVIDKEATKDETGLKHEECTVCGYERNKNTEIAKVTGSTDGTADNDNKNDTNTDKNNNNTGGTADKASGTNKSGSVTSTTNKNAASPKTGDSSQPILWLSILSISAVAMAGSVVLTKRRRKY